MALKDDLEMNMSNPLEQIRLLAAAIAVADDDLSASGAAVANLAGTMTGSVDGTIADVADIAISTSGGNTYADSAVNTAVNTAIASVNLQLKELQAKLNALLSSLRTAGVIDT